RAGAWFAEAIGELSGVDRCRPEGGEQVSRTVEGDWEGGLQRAVEVSVDHRMGEDIPRPSGRILTCRDRLHHQRSLLSQRTVLETPWQCFNLLRADEVVERSHRLNVRGSDLSDQLEILPARMC